MVRSTSGYAWHVRVGGMRIGGFLGGDAPYQVKLSGILGVSWAWKKDISVVSFGRLSEKPNIETRSWCGMVV